MELALYLGLFSPLAGFIILLLSSDWIGRKATNLIGCASIFISFLIFTSFLFQADDLNTTLYRWISFNQIQADFGLHLDHLALLMTLIITGVGFLIHVYSIGYIEHEVDYARFFACMNFFVFSMLLLVLASNLLLLFVGWEGVGLASYLLIGYWYFKPTAAQAATKAFVINRIGDLGFLIGILLTFYLFGTSDIEEISSMASQVGTQTITILTLLYFCGAVAKSAQIPLQVWLPDAMEGPTPVSALIHAATMVTAGVYLVVRLHSVFLLAPVTLYVIAIVGVATAFYAAVCAMGQTDLKRVLAYSTVSQLGYMFLACGVGAFYAAMFHLTMHAFMKALLFLSAGNIVHMMHGNTEMTKMGGLSSKFPKTYVFFLIGVLAMSGIPPLAAFFSKDLILEQTDLVGFKILFYIGLVVAVLTAFYLTRAFFLTFTGRTHVEDKTVHEAPSIMLIPVAILALLSIIGGFLGFSINEPPVLEEFLEQGDPTLVGPQIEEGFHFTYVTWLSIIGALLGVGIAAAAYTYYLDRLGPTIQILRRSFYIDEIYSVLFVKPLRSFALFIDRVLEPKFFDRSIHFTTRSTERIAGWLQHMQSGQIRSYIAWMALGTVVLIVYFIL